MDFIHKVPVASLRSLVFLTLIVTCSIINGNASTGDGCSWSYDITSVENPTEKKVLFNNVKDLKLITDTINSFDLGNLQAVVQLSHVKARQLSLNGMKPTITIRYQSAKFDGRSVGIIKYKTKGALVDLGQLDDNCQYNLCRPAWLIPVPTDNSTNVLMITVSTTGAADSDSLTNFEESLPMNGFANSNGQLYLGFTALETAFNSITSNLYLHQPCQLNYLPGLSPTIILGDVSSGGNIFVLVEEQTRRLGHSTLQGVSLVLPQGTNVCGSNIQSTSAALQDRIILATKLGVYEILGNFQRNDHGGISTLSPTLKFDKCVGGLSVSLQGVAQWQYIILHGAGPQQGKVYASRVDTKSGVNINFTKMFDGGFEICSLMLDTSYCRLVSSTSAGAHKGILLFLLHVVHTNNTAFYAIVQHTHGLNESGSWSIQSKIPLTVSVDSTAAAPTSLPLLLQTDPSTNISSINLNLTGIAFARQVGLHVYLWGTRLLHSPDAGKHVYLVQTYSKNETISLVATSAEGLIIFLTHSGEIWAGTVGLVKMEKIHPSSAWDRVQGMQQSGCTSSLCMINETILTFYFSIKDQLQMVTVNKQNGNVTRHRVFVAEILAQLAYEGATQRALTSADKSQRMKSLVIPRLCPFSKIFLQLPNQQQYSQYQEFEHWYPKLSSSIKIHSNSSLLAYQAILQTLQRKHVEYKRAYADNYRNYVERWKDDHDDHQIYHSYQFQNKLLTGNMQINLDSHQRFYTSNDFTVAANLPESIYLDRKDSYTFFLQLALQPTHSQVTSVLADKDVENLDISVKVPDRSFVSTTIEKHYSYHNSSILYKIALTELAQVSHKGEPGAQLHLTSLAVQVMGAPLVCFQANQQELVEQGSFHTALYLGCPPTRQVVFDVQASIDKLIALRETPSDCLEVDPDMHCFYFGNGFYPYFKVVDEATGTSWRYTGRYTLNVVGGSADGMDTIQNFTAEDIHEQNNQQSTRLIWGPMTQDTVGADGNPVYTYEQNAMSWLCRSGSVCSNLIPKFPKTPEYYFLVQFANGDVDTESTYCNFVVNFVIHVHGLPIDAINMSLPLVLASLMAVCISLAIYAVCHYNQDKLVQKLKQLVGKRRAVVIPGGSAGDAEIDMAVFAEKLQKQERRFSGRRFSGRRLSETVTPHVGALPRPLMDEIIEGDHETSTVLGGKSTSSAATAASTIDEARVASSADQV